MRRPSRFRVAILAGFVILAVASSTASPSLQDDEKPQRDPSGVPPANPLANPKPDANQRMLYQMQLVQSQKRMEELNTLRQKEMREDTSRLLRLAAEVKVETNHSPSSSQAVLDLRKVERIEKLARSVREKMKTTVN